MQIRQGSRQKANNWNMTKDDQLNGLNSRKTVFVVESNQVRQIEEIPMTEDIEVTACPVIDYGLPIDQQGQTFLGKSYTMKDWPGQSNPNAKYVASLTAVRTANPYFADFQTQNASVFSFFDDLSLTVDNSQWQLANAKISYFIIGFHTNAQTVDPLAMPLVISLSPDDGPSQNPADRLEACQMQVKSQTALKEETSDGLANGGIQLRTLCHGSLNNIYWNIDSSSRVNVQFPGDAIQNAFDTSHPLAVGTNALDSMYAWLAIQDSSTVPPDVQAQLMRLQSYVLDINDDLDSQLQAEDLLATNNFVPTPCGTRFIFNSPDSSNEKYLTELIERNSERARLDALVRQYDHFKEDMFSLWWKFICDDGKSTTADLQTLTNAVSALRSNMTKNKTLRDNGLITPISQDFESAIQPVAEESFCMQRDPTLLVAGLQSSWPQSLNEKVNVRFFEQLFPNQEPTRLDLNPNTAILQDLGDKAPKELYDDIARFWEECDRLSGGDNYFGGYNPPASDSLVDPDFHGDGGDEWNESNDNGWFPLFIEWEVEYYDIPWQYWQFAPYGPEGRMGYGIRDGVNLAALGLENDYMVIKGRSPVLPQASATLETALKQVFAKVNPDVLEQTISSADQDKLIEAVRNMDFLGTPMTGFNDQLVTRMQGSHATPLTFTATGADVPQDILDKANHSIGMIKDDFLLMDSGSDTTPFASLVPVLADTSKYSPFKPVTHGQFRFTKFNIIDKFGQMVQGIKLTNEKLTGAGSMSQANTPLFPCLSENYSLETLSAPDDLKGLANAVLRRQDGLCSFVQLPPSINQPVRVNAEFVTPVAPESPQFRRLEDHENPCRGYLVINYANASFQVFTTEGQFVREYSVRNGKIVSLPFPPNAQLGAGLDPLLQQLLSMFTDTAYLINLFQNISTTIEAVQANPTHFAESMLSILGRPLALVTFGVSLELEGPPLTNQSTIHITKPPQPTDSILGYDFALKIGDKDNVFDGLYGYFPAIPDSTMGAFDLSTFYSYHDPDTAKNPSLTSLKPFYIDPLTVNSTATYTAQRASQYKLYAALIDPFTPLHLYTALLPIKQLQIPAWALQEGVSRIATFFRMGPILSPADVPAFDPTQVVAEDYRLDDDARRPKEIGTLGVPSVSVADWSWLQPYWDDVGGKTRYNLLGLTSVDGKIRYEQPPYVAVEGYLQMKKSFVKADT